MLNVSSPLMTCAGAGIAAAVQRQAAADAAATTLLQHARVHGDRPRRAQLCLPRPKGLFMPTYTNSRSRSPVHTASEPAVSSGKTWRHSSACMACNVAFYCCKYWSKWSSAPDTTALPLCLLLSVQKVYPWEIHLPSLWQQRICRVSVEWPKHNLLPCCRRSWASLVASTQSSSTTPSWSRATGSTSACNGTTFERTTCSERRSNETAASEC